jgi:catechol 2,3-dioxygenase-like lactoylglutathione lyase family enzyme
MIRRLAHLCLFTDDLPRVLDFYRDGLGLAVKFRFAAADGAIFGAYISTGDSTFVEFFDRRLAALQWGGDTSPVTLGNRYGHLCLEVTGLVDFCALLQQRGVAVEPIRSGLDHSWQAWLSDPDGNRIELMEYTSRSTQVRPGEDLVVRSER